MKTKTYSRNVFSGKNVPYIGISEGHGKLYRGNSVEFSINLSYNGSIESREGMLMSNTLEGTIHAGNSGVLRCICSGSNISAERP